MFPKQERLLGQKIETAILESLEAVLSASYASKLSKNLLLKKASEKIDLLKYMIRLGFEVKAINFKKYIELEEKILKIGKMVGGWLRSS